MVRAHEAAVEGVVLGGVHHDVGSVNLARVDLFLQGGAQRGELVQGGGGAQTQLLQHVETIGIGGEGLSAHDVLGVLGAVPEDVGGAVGVVVVCLALGMACDVVLVVVDVILILGQVQHNAFLAVFLDGAALGVAVDVSHAAGSQLGQLVGAEVGPGSLGELDLNVNAQVVLHGLLPELLDLGAGAGLVEQGDVRLDLQHAAGDLGQHHAVVGGGGPGGEVDGPLIVRDLSARDAQHAQRHHQRQQEGKELFHAESTSLSFRRRSGSFY